MARLVEAEPSVSHTLSDFLRIGRGEENDIVLEEATVSRRHAEVRRTARSDYVLTDLGSTHGTYVGGVRVTETTLRDGDEVALGRARLSFCADSPLELETPELRIQAATPAQDTGTRERPATLRPFPPAAAIGDPALMARGYERLRAAFALSRAIGVEHDVDKILNVVLGTTVDLIRADRAAALIFEPNTLRVVARSARVRSGGTDEIALSRSIIRQVVQSKEAVRCDDASQDSRFRGSESIVSSGIRSTICVPMLYRGDVLGILHVDTVDQSGPFDDTDFDVLRAVAEQAALSIANAQLVLRVQTVRDIEQQHLNDVVRGLPVGVMLIGSGGRILLANPAAEDLLASVVAALGRAATHPAGRASQSTFAATYVAALVQQIPEGPPVDVAMPGARPRIVETSVVRCRHGYDGETIVVLRDVSAERDREQRESRQERLALLGQITGGVAHDFNNLLSVIVNYADILLRRPMEPAARDEAELIGQAGRRAAGLTRQLLAFSQRSLTLPELVSVNRLIHDLERLLRRTLGSHMTLHTELTTDLPPVLVDPAKFEQVLLNLVLNARDAMPDGGRVVVKTELRAPSERSLDPIDKAATLRTPITRGEVVLSVRDSGQGMPAEVAARIFEPFYTTKAPGHGTGLGLATVQRVVTQAGGRVDFETAEGEGTVFRVSFPAALGELPDTRPEKAPREPTGTESILLVEDDDTVRAVMRRILTEGGYRVVDAACGDDALHIVRDRVSGEHGPRFDLLVTDVLMPRVGGVRLASRLREQLLNLRVLYVSGFAGSMDPDEMPSDPLVVKPFTRESLLSAVRDVLDR